MNFKLSKYIIPSVISMVLVGTYTNIDGFFIGNVTGDDGLAAINIVWPIVALITAIGVGIGIGGSVMMSNMRGKEDERGAERIKNTTLFLLLTVGLLTGLVFKLASPTLLTWMGAEGRIYDYAVAYADIICIGAVFQILGAGLAAILRNEQKTYFSMICCITGLLVHLLLDMLLVETYTLAGVAFSTVVSQAVIMVMCMFVLRVKREAGIAWREIPGVLKASTSPLGINFVPSVVLLFTNYFALEAGGTAAVSAYAVMSYAVYTFDYIFQGVCDGVQPIISYCYGAGDKQGENRALRVSAYIQIAFSLVFIALTPALIALMPVVFNTSGVAADMMKSGFIIYAFSYPFKAAVKYICSYYYACGETLTSNILIYLDPLVLTPLFLILLPMAFGTDGIWLAMTLAQLLLTAIGGVVLWRYLRKRNKMIAK